MLHYQLDYVVEETLKNMPNREQLLLKKYLGKNFEKAEAEYLWNRIADHKWYVSERLGRDIGFRVAAIDFIENFYEPKRNQSKSGVFQKIFRPLAAGLRSYLISKSKVFLQ